MKTGTRTLKDAITEAMRDWVTNVASTHYVIGSVMGPHPFPMIVRDFQRVIGDEARAQLLELTGRLPDAVTACVGGGSNAMGIFTAFVPDAGVQLVGYEAGGDGHRGRHARGHDRGRTPGVLHGMRTYLLQDPDGQTLPTRLGLGRAGLSRRRPRACLARTTPAGPRYRSVTDGQAMAALELLAHTEGILCAIESAHAIAGAVELPASWGRTRSCWSACPAGGTRTWTRPRAGSACW